MVEFHDGITGITQHQHRQIIIIIINWNLFQCYGGNTNLNNMAQVKSFILSHTEIKYLLVVNEPNLVDQANRTQIRQLATGLCMDKLFLI